MVSKILKTLSLITILYISGLTIYYIGHNAGFDLGYKVGKADSYFKAHSCHLKHNGVLEEG